MIVVEFADSIFYAENIILAQKRTVADQPVVDVYIATGTDYITLTEEYNGEEEADEALCSILADMLSTQMTGLKRKNDNEK